ncbi:MAG: carbohydrate kinase family protein [Microbacterium sp.]|uniref:carbohydrate kinase family protein n=1 Tax=Microbacterium sp. TaxID=51671 RepID=UPI0039E30FC3
MTSSAVALPKKIAVLGPIPRDHVTTHRGDVLEKYGCALYTAIALSALVGPDGVVVPIVNTGEQDIDAIRDILGAYDNIDLTGIRAVGDRSTVIDLHFVDQNNRLERQTGFMTPITPEDVEFALDAEAFVCVPVTDYEVTLSTLEYIRENSDGIILLDGHGPTTALSIGGERVRRLWLDIDEWLPTIDVLKMNLEEAGCSALPGPGDDRKPGDPIPVAQIKDFAAYALERGVKAVSVTLDESGCVAYTLDESGEVVEHEVGRVPVEHVVDTTGCGDSFAAGMGFGFLLDGDIVTACRYGNAMGAQRAAATALDGYLSYEDTTRQLVAAYGSARGEA